MAAPAVPLAFKESPAEEAACLLAGAVVTLALFGGLAFTQRRENAAPPAPVENLRVFSVPLEPPPPPPPSTTAAAAEASAPQLLATGIEASPADSPVQITVSPPAFDLPASAGTVPAEIDVARVYPEFKPGAGLAINEQRVYPEAEVDQLPRAVKRSLQFIPYGLRINLTEIRVVLVVLMEKSGRARSVRVVKSCGTPALDEIVARSVQEDWLFSPALKRGRPVRCFVEQTFVIKLVPGSPLEAY